jgi:hypothetical protein
MRIPAVAIIAAEEWRGVRTRNGFTPYAAIVRVITKHPETMRGGGHVLAVVRMERHNACLAAVEVAANKDANALAREAADGFARTFACETDKPRPFGTTTEWMEQVIGAEGRAKE